MAYIGSSPTKVVSRQSANIFTYTATANQTAFTGAATDGNTLACTPSDIMVHMNGLRLEQSDYTASTTTVTLGSGAAAGDEVTITAFLTFERDAAVTNVADNVVDEANLKVSNTPTNGYFLSAQSGNTGGLTWAAVPAGYANSDVDAHLLTSGVTLDATNDRVGIGTTSPNHPLQVNGGAADTAFQITNSASGSAITDGFSITVENPTANVSIRNRENTNMSFLTNNTEAMRIDSSGNVGIGTSSPDSTLTISDTVPIIKLIDSDDSTFSRVYHSAGTLVFDADKGNTGSSSNILFTVDDTERFRFGTSGQLGIGGANYGSSGQYLKSNGSGAAPSWASVSSGYGYYDSPTFYNLTIQGTGTFNSSVTFNSTVTVWGSFNNYSDDRLKVKSNNIPEALSKISKLNGFYYTDSDAVTDIKKGKDKEGNQLYQEKETTQKLGVSAQELEAVLPEVISKLDSSVSATNTEYLAVDYTKIVPLLIEGIKELKTKVETLETKVAALEGG